MTTEEPSAPAATSTAVSVTKAKGWPMLSWVGLVHGKYELEAIDADRPAVRITDMLGEEILVVEPQD